MAFCLAFVLSQIKSIVSAKHCLNESVLRKFWKGLLCHYSLCAYGSLFKCFSELKTTFLGSLVRYIHAEKHTETEVRLSTALDHSQVLSHTPSWLFFWVLRSDSRSCRDLHRLARINTHGFSLDDIHSCARLY